jgi:NADH-quinone oxidoreductase subunit J
MDPVFLVSSAVALVAALMTVTRRNPVYCAVWLLVTFVAVAVTFVTLSAPFLAAIHVLVYTGAILVLFVFVIMLLNLRDDEVGDEYPLGTRAGVAVMSAVLFGALAWPILQDRTLDLAVVPRGEAHGSVEAVGHLMFTTYGLPFELVSVLIVVAMFGAMVLAKKRLE